MKKLIKLMTTYYQIFLISVTLWCILNESISLIMLIEGLVVGLITALSLNRLLGDDNHYANKDNFSFFTIVHYYIILFISIYKSTFSIIKIIFSENPTPQIVRYKSDIQHPWARSLIANSITLTPGTVSIDDKSKEMTVLWLKPTTNNNREYCHIIQGDFEKVFENERKKHV